MKRIRLHPWANKHAFHAVLVYHTSEEPLVKTGEGEIILPEGSELTMLYCAECGYPLEEKLDYVIE